MTNMFEDIKKFIKRTVYDSNSSTERDMCYHWDPRSFYDVSPEIYVQPQAVAMV